VVSSLLGGLPMTSVVVRTSANSDAGAKSKMSAIIHGVLLLVSVLVIPTILNKIPLATLAAILLLVGYKLANPKTIMHFWQKGKYQFIPFIATLLAVVFTDLLKGVALGMVISIVFVLKGNMQRAYKFRNEGYLDGDVIHIDLAQEVSFLNKAAIKSTLVTIPDNSRVEINATDTVYIAHDVLDLIKEFKKITSKERNIKVKLVGFKKVYGLVETGEEEKHVFVEHKN
jgi:MFS superfamily sulfate permease-like transporter